MANEEIVRIYGKRWDIDVFFKMLKHYLNLEREVQLRDYNGLIGHITITICQYIFLAYEQQCHDDPRTLGSLFYVCSDELQDLSLIEALNRILSLAIDKVHATGIVTEDVAGRGARLCAPTDLSIKRRKENTQKKKIKIVSPACQKRPGERMPDFSLISPVFEFIFKNINLTGGFE